MKQISPPPAKAAARQGFSGQGGERHVAVMTSPQSAALSLRLLGRVEAVRDGVTVALGRRRERAALAILANECGRIVSTNRLTNLLWEVESRPAAARRTLQAHIARLRSLIRGVKDWEIESSGDGYRLRADPLCVDVHLFRDLLARARRADDPAVRAGLLREALDLSRGPALNGSLVGHVRDTLGRELDELVQTATDEWYETILHLGGHRAHCASLVCLAVENPERENLTRMAMVALYRCDRAVDALNLFARCREYLIDRFGLEPGPQLTATRTAILRNDPELMAAAPESTV